ETARILVDGFAAGRNLEDDTGSANESGFYIAQERELRAQLHFGEADSTRGGRPVAAVDRRPTQFVDRQREPLGEGNGRLNAKELGVTAAKGRIAVRDRLDQEDRPHFGQ